MLEASSSVLDASALLAFLRDERGAETVWSSLAVGAAMSVVNYAEVLTRLAEAGEAPAAAHRRMQDSGLIGGMVLLVPLTEDDAIAISELRATTRLFGLSLADRACLATALRLGLPVLTADRSWAEAPIDIAVHLIRP
jgi:PIN domain nuclease of toxin-antitoxin system